MSDRILVIGETGTIGSELLRGLTAAGIETRALTRRAEGGTSLPRSPTQRRHLEQLLLGRSNLRTVQAYQMKLAFQDFWDLPASEADPFLDIWCAWVRDSGLAPMVRLAQTVHSHRAGILRWFQTRISNGLLEGISSLVQAAKARARGYRSTRNLTAIIYLTNGKLPIYAPI